MSESEAYEVFAVRYATKQDRRRSENFILADPHDGIMPIDYFLWVIRNSSRTIVVDTGFDHEEGQKRARQVLRLPREGLAMLGIEAAQVKDVVITHLHYDHAGTLEDFSTARFHLQEREMSYATGRHMSQPQPFAHAYVPDHVCALVRRVFDGRVVFHDGVSEIASGVSLHRIGGHTMGMQCVRVRTARGWVVLASDAAHFYANLELDRPYAIVHSLPGMYDAFDRVRALADGDDRRIVPGHDPLVLERFAAPSGDLDGRAVEIVAPA
jgi:glyoxylase-like metal-dependent hydrolase (beta-lactamase superfamily II)